MDITIQNQWVCRYTRNSSSPNDSVANVKAAAERLRQAVVERGHAAIVRVAEIASLCRRGCGKENVPGDQDVCLNFL